jgi:hypothetical protein
VWPVTALFGPIAAFNVLVTLAPVVNGWSMFVLLRAVTGFLPGQVIGAFFYAYSPYVMANVAFGDFNADYLFFPPLALWCLYGLLVGHHSPRRLGLLLGALGVVQFFFGPELLATSVLMALFGAVIALAVARELIWSRRAEILRFLGIAATIWILVLAYPAWYLVDGPRHITGIPWRGTPVFGASWSNVIDPGPYGSPSPFAEIGGYFGPVGPNFAYLGIALVLALALSFPLWRRRRLAIVMGGSGLIAWLLSLGSGGRDAAWTPWRLFEHLPLFKEALPGRFTVYVDLAVAVLIAVALERAWQAAPRAADYARRFWSAGRRPLQLGFGALCTALAIGVLVPVVLTYQLPFQVYARPAPAWFRLIAPKLRGEPVLLTLPFPTPASADAMAWQADAGLSFRMAGGYAQVPGPDGRSETIVPPTGAEALLRRLSFFGYGAEPPYTAANAALLRAAIKRWRINEIVITAVGRDPEYAVSYLTRVLGRAPRIQDGAWVWA